MTEHNRTRHPLQPLLDRSFGLLDRLGNILGQHEEVIAKLEETNGLERIGAEGINPWEQKRMAEEEGIALETILALLKAISKYQPSIEKPVYEAIVLLLQSREEMCQEIEKHLAEIEKLV